MDDSADQIGISSVGSPLPTVEEILEDPVASRWLKNALRTALLLDPVDAANNAEVLNLVLARRCQSILEQDLSTSDASRHNISESSPRT